MNQKKKIVIISGLCTSVFLFVLTGIFSLYYETDNISSEFIEITNNFEGWPFVPDFQIGIKSGNGILFFSSSVATIEQAKFNHEPYSLELEIFSIGSGEIELAIPKNVWNRILDEGKPGVTLEIDGNSQPFVDLKTSNEYVFLKTDVAKETKTVLFFS